MELRALVPTPKEFQTSWPLFVLQDLIGYLQTNNYLRTAEMMNDAAFVFMEEHRALGHDVNSATECAVERNSARNLN